MQRGINYENTGRSNRASISSYHSSPAPLEHHKGAKNVDIAHLNRKKQNQLFESIRTASGRDYNALFTIGFEIEKNELHNSSIQEYPLFKGFERDSSCGFEAITHILPLLPPCKWRNKIFDMMVQAKALIDDAYSPSNSQCGGHITIGVKGLSGQELAEKLAKYMGIVLAIYRKRLSNSFCFNNPFVATPSNHDTGIGYEMDRYSAMLIKSDTIELRLPNRITSVRQMMLRYELMYLLVDTAINRNTMSSNKFFEMVRPIIEKMYVGEPKKVEFLMWLAPLFQDSINRNKYNEVTAYYSIMRFRLLGRDRRSILTTLKKFCTIKGFRYFKDGISGTVNYRDEVYHKMKGMSAVVINAKLKKLFEGDSGESVRELGAQHFENAELQARMMTGEELSRILQLI